ncbi:endonuclease/exonuclease/phosphatase family protein [Kineococcus gynurae]|uniref:Endonuclease/exonuclease/phosphatase family protein n=1 Tax=Kineococcus gynurae TaxID=452979 RepID=A0ABV5LU78_9ACTN
MPTSRPVSSARRPLSLVGAGALTLAAALVAFPETVGLGGARPWVWIVPFRVPVGLGLAATAGVALLAGVRWRSLLPTALGLGLVAGVHGGTTVVRGLGEGHLPPARPGDVTVAGANLYVARADPSSVADLVLRDGIDVLALPETDRVLADRVAELVGARDGTPPTVFWTADGDPADPERMGTALLVSPRLGEYRSTGEVTGGLKAVVTARPVDGTGPVLVAAHTAAPIPRWLPAWRAETAAVVDFCERTPGVLLAGDLNATLDHPALAGLQHCAEAATAGGSGARGTWPADRSALLGAHIDHTLGDRRAWVPVGSRVVEVEGSDHRAVVARWRPVQE